MKSSACVEVLYFKVTCWSTTISLAPRAPVEGLALIAVLKYVVAVVVAVGIEDTAVAYLSESINALYPAYVEFSCLTFAVLDSRVVTLVFNEPLLVVN